MHTPWGRADSQHTLAPGLIQVSTGRHGGYYVDESRWRELETLFPGFKSFTARGWLEEDCDWCFAPLAWPELFTSQEIFNAYRTLKAWHKEIPETWDNTMQGQKVLKIARDYEHTTLGKWETGGMFGPVDGYPIHSWGVMLRRNEERKTVVFSEYPRQQFYTDAELQTVQAHK